jgi:D-alanine-D-alanine ligase
MQSKSLRIGLLYGGQSVEHQVSCRSAQTVAYQLQQLGHTVIPIAISREGRWSEGNEQYQAIFDANRELMITPGNGLFSVHTAQHFPIDIAFPVTHGTCGEDGKLQGLLELAQIPYVGCDSETSVYGMHKYTTKIFAREAGIPTLDALVVDTRRLASVNSETDPYIIEITEQVRLHLGDAVIIKPEDGGSSVGITVVQPVTPTTLYHAMLQCKSFTQSIMIEPYLSDMMELEVAILTQEDDLLASDPGRLINPMQQTDRLVTYEQKYLSDHCAYMKIPADISDEVSHQVSHFALQLARQVRVQGYARVDFFYRISDQTIFFNEINTLPGMTATRHFPILAQNLGYQWPELLSLLLSEGMRAHQRRETRQVYAVE